MTLLSASLRRRFVLPSDTVGCHGVRADTARVMPRKAARILYTVFCNVTCGQVKGKNF